VRPCTCRVNKNLKKEVRKGEAGTKRSAQSMEQEGILGGSGEGVPNRKLDEKKTSRSHAIVDGNLNPNKDTGEKKNGGTGKGGGRLTKEGC